MINVLLVDDHALVRDALRYLLEASGDIKVVGTAPNGKLAVELASLQNPDIIVMDASMPEMDGIEATRRISEAGLGTRVVMLSMYNNAETIQRALRAGAAGYVLKDDAGDELLHAIRALQEGGRFFSPRITKIASDYLSQQGLM